LLVAWQQLFGDCLVIVPVPARAGGRVSPVEARHLPSIDGGEQVPDVEAPQVHLNVANASLEQCDLVSRVTDQEPHRQGRSPVLLPQEPEAEAVEGRHMDLAASGAREVSNAVLHLLRRLVREGDGQNGYRGDSLLCEPGNAMCDDACLPRPSTRENEFRPLLLDDSLSLRRVESGQVEHGAVRLVTRAAWLQGLDRPPNLREEDVRSDPQWPDRQP